MRRTIDVAELRTLGLAPLLPLWVAAAYVAWGQVSFYHRQGTIAQDAHAYWLTARSSALYSVPPGGADAYLYSPAFAQLIWPVAQLPWPAFATLWLAFEFVVFAWLLAPLGWRWALPLVLLCSFEVVLGNVYAGLALSAVLGTTRAVFWCFPLFTKITPAVGALWLVGRRQWRHVAALAATTTLLGGASFALAPGAWMDWANFLLTTPRAPAPVMPFRMAAGAVLVLVAARQYRPWLIAPAMLLASPVVAVNSLTLLTAIPRLMQVRQAGPAGPEGGIAPRSTG